MKTETKKYLAIAAALAVIAAFVGLTRDARAGGILGALAVFIALYPLRNSRGKDGH